MSAVQLVAALERIVAARRAVHDETCIRKEEFPCLNCPSVGAVARGLDALDARPRDVAAVRLYMHNEACVSGCTGDSAADHARRTQGPPATALRRFHRSERVA